MEGTPPLPSHFDFGTYDLGQMEAYDADGARRLLDQFCAMWIPEEGGDPSSLVRRNFGDGLSPSQVEEVGAKCAKDVLFVIILCGNRGINGDDGDGRKMLRLEEAVYWAYETARSASRLSRVMDPRCAAAEMTDETNPIRFQKPDATDNTGFQNLLLWLLRETRNRGYRKHGNYCMKRVYVPDPVDGTPLFTHAWEKDVTVKQFIYSACARHVGGGCHWKDMTSHFQNVDHAEKYLLESEDTEFPVLRKHRQAWSFANGVYEASSNRFVEYGDGPVIDPDRATAKFFDEPFDPSWARTASWRDIPTPHLDAVLEYQEFAPEVKDWFYISTGRVFWPVGEKDNFQYVPFLKGMALAGKSTLITNIFRRLYDGEDIGVLSNNIEPIFGLSQFYDKFMYVAPEIKANLQLDQANMQSMASGESMVIVIKGKTPFSIPAWMVQGVWAGNAAPGYDDNSGSVARRFLVFAFSKMVGSNEDTDLPRKLRDEVPAIICKSARAYLEAVETYAGRGFWNIVPAYFKQTKDDLQAATNPLVSFMTDAAAVVMEPYEYVQEMDFKKAFFDWCEANGMRRPRWNKDYYQGVFQQKGILIEAKAHYKPRNGDVLAPLRHGTWFKGCNVVVGVPAPVPVSNTVQ